MRKGATVITLAAVPEGHGYLVDCSECGPLGIIEGHLLPGYANDHLTAHGLAMPISGPICTCGYDYANTTGHAKDLAACTDCTWSSAGIFADHLAHHHHLETKHIWVLTIGAAQP